MHRVSCGDVDNFFLIWNTFNVFILWIKCDKQQNDAKSRNGIDIEPIEWIAASKGDISIWM